MKTNWLLILLYFPFMLYAQHGQQNKSINITIEELKDHMYYLASDALKGRMPGEDGYLKAVEYAVSQFKQSGLKPIFIDEKGDSTYLQAIQFEKHTWDSTNNMIIHKKNSQKQEFKQGLNFIIVMGKPFDVTKIEGEVVFVSAGIREPDYGIDNYANADVTGKWVVAYSNVTWLDKFLPQTVIQEKYSNPASYNNLIFQNAREAGAIGVLAIADKQYSANFKMLAKVFNQQILSKKVTDNFFNAEFPVVLIDSTIASSLFTVPINNPSVNDTLYNSFELKNMNITLNKNTHLQEFESYNVGAMYPGNDPSLKEEYITVGAHLDHIGTMDDMVFNGADDNASGSIGVIEIAEEIAQNRPKRPALFLLFTAEEMGLIGSEYFVKQPPVPLSQIKVNINLDMISRSDGNVEKGIAPVILYKSSNLKNELIETNKKFPHVELDWAYADSSAIAGLSDHFSFHKRNIPTVFFSSGMHPDYHNIGDDPEKVDYDFFMNNCHLIYQLVYNLGNKEKLQLFPAD